jgi:hypothetical protein
MVVNLDNFGSNLSRLSPGITSDLEDFCRKLVDKMKIQDHCRDIPLRAVSDQHSFVEMDVPCLWIADCTSDASYHTPLDVPAQMSSLKPEQAASVALVGEVIRTCFQ